MAAHPVLDPKRPLKLRSGCCALAVMTKVPRAGKVKTRLAPPLTPEEAAALNICFLRDAMSAISGAAKLGNAAGIAVYTPVGEEEAYRGILPDEISLIPQRGDGFGDRLSFATEDLLGIGFESVCLINSDSPTLPERVYEQAAKLLSGGGDRIVLGPSDDGGYYLIGLKKPHRDVFQRIDWSTEQVFSQTVERAAEIGMQVELLPAWYDVDDRVTLCRLCQELFGGDSNPPAGYAAPYTRSYLAELFHREGRARIWPNE